MMTNKWLASVLWIVLGAAGMVLIGFAYNQLLEPRQAMLPSPYTEVPDYDRISREITVASLQRDLDRYAALGSRFSGSPGFYQTEEMLAERLQELGYRLVFQEHEVVVPQTRFCDLLGEDGQPIPGVEIHPYYPNRLRTATTPPDGITGQVVFKGDPSGEDKIPALDAAMGNILLLRVREPFQDYANFGARAIFYFLDEENDPKAAYFRRKDSHASINVPVFFLSGDPKSLIGRTVTVRARVDWVATPVRNIFAILDPAAAVQGGLEETVLVSAYYDAWSPIPGMAPGARQLLGVQGVMQTAEHLAASANRQAFRRKIVLALIGGHGQAAAGSRHLMSALGAMPDPARQIAALEEEQKELVNELSQLRELEGLIPAYFETVGTRSEHAAFWAGRKDTQVLFREELSLAIDAVAQTAEEDALDARLEWLRGGGKKGPALDSFLARNKRATVYHSMVGAKPYVLATGGGRWSDKGYRSYYAEGAYWEPGGETQAGTGGARHAKMYEADYDSFLRERLKALLERVRYRVERNEFRLKQNEQDRVVFNEIRGVDGGRRVLGLEVNFSDKTRQLFLGTGGWYWASRCVPADREIELEFRYAQEALYPLLDEASAFESRVSSGDAWGSGVYWFVNDLQASQMTFAGYTSFVLLTKGDDREFFACPLDTPEGINWENVVAQERVIVGGIERIALGGGTLLDTSMPVHTREFRGLTASVRGTSLVPNHPEAHTVVQMTCGLWAPSSWRHYSQGGSYWSAMMDPYPLTMSDELGRFRFRRSFGLRHWRVDFHAARANPETGDLEWIRDLGYEAKYPTQELRVHQVGELTRIIMFRATPIHIFKAENPQSMKLYDRIEARLIRGFSKPKRFFAEQSHAGEYVLYLEPDARFFPTFLFGSPHNQSLLRIAGIGLNIGPEDYAAIRADQDEIEGEGYLAADATFLYHPEDDLARSMSAINSRRAMRYGKYGLLDEPTLEAAESARDLALQGQGLREADENYKAFMTMKDSLAYSTSIHPVIRNSKAEAVYGIVFYLLLLIPFAFFMEKLVIGHSDIRWQIFWVGTIFLAVFMLLRQVHPAFEIVRSSFMILLGFITLMLSLVVTMFVSSKFRAAVVEYQKLIHGQQASADVTKASAAMTGFLLGINNMRKRKVRTALTATTLVLITFVMICFTAVDNDYVEVIYPIGKAPYTGLEIRRNTLAHLGTQTAVLVNAFENDFDVAVRRWDVGSIWGLMPMNKKLEAETYISREEIDNLAVTLLRESDEDTRRWTSRGSLGLGPSPDADLSKALLCGTTWFVGEVDRACVLSLPAAAALGITPEMVRRETKPTVLLKGRELSVINLFDPDAFAALRDSRGRSLLPVDQEVETRYRADLKAAEQQRRRAERLAAENQDVEGSSQTAPAIVDSPPVVREPVRLDAADLVLFPTQRQPRPEAIVSHFKGKLRLNQKEPINFDRMFISSVPPHFEDDRRGHYWFRNDEPDTCFIPARMAAEMQILPEAVAAGNVRISVEGTVLTVKGIYESNRFEQIRDLDGETLAPFDVESIIGRPREDDADEDEIPEMMKRLSGDDIIICNDQSRTTGYHVASIAIDLSRAGSHKRVRQILDRYLEKTGSKAFYGIGDTAYFGAKFRRPRGSNYMELLIPLLIASLTVLNTMRGSVYERKDEIYVYNAVGLNPFHVFFLFIAEACVYAVVGALGGYLVANFAGKLVGMLGLSAGLTINYSSIYAVMYSVVIMAAVLLSTWFPARAAARLAAPAEEMRWRVPEPEDGAIRFTLPFTFSVRDRVAIVAYFMGWFDEFGEGSSGRFFCTAPTCSMETLGERLASTVRTTAWLRPYDLGVSQEVVMQFSEDPRTGQTLARLSLHHLSGGVSAWIRTNYLFLKILRKHFLDWRVVPEMEKLSFLQRARAQLGARKDLLAAAETAIQEQIAALKARQDEQDEGQDPALESDAGE